MERQKIYTVLDGERNYQNTRWTDPSASISEFTLFVDHHSKEAMKVASTTDFSNPENRDACLAQLRKVAALCVACFEEHGVPERQV